jgi:hypothetical protein
VRTRLTVASGAIYTLALLAWPIGSAIGQAPSGPSLEIAGTLFQVTIGDGRSLASPELIGAVLDVIDDTGRLVTVRIDGVARDPADADGDVWLHRLSILDLPTGVWRELCTPGPDGTVAAFPVAGGWISDGTHLRGSSGFIVSCTSGAIGKCVRLGYKPWREVGGESLWDYHQACVRAIRADYGGDGTGHTRDGTLVDIFDRLRIQPPEPDPRGPALEFEAAWGPDGAVCVRRTRIPELLSTDELARRYPRLAGRIGGDCSEAAAALLWNRS